MSQDILGAIGIVVFSCFVVFLAYWLAHLKRKSPKQLRSELEDQILQGRPTEPRYRGTCNCCGCEVEKWGDECKVYVIPGNNGFGSSGPYAIHVLYVPCPNECGVYMIEHIDMKFKSYEVRPTEMEILGRLVKEAEEIENL